MPRLSIKHVWAVLPSALVVVATAMDRQYLTDFWHHLARGREIVGRGEILNVDVFTFTVGGQRIVDVNWLTQVLYYGLYCAGGLELVQVVNSLMLAAMAGGLVWLCWRACGSVRIAAAVSIAALAAMWGLFTVRPQTLSMLLFVAMAIVLELSHTRRWVIWLAPLLVALWANVHGAFVAGVLLVGCHLVGNLRRDSAAGARTGGRPRAESASRLPPSAEPPVRVPAALFAILALTLLATLANPYGIEAWTYVWRTGSRAAGRGIEEWLAPDLHSALGAGFWLSVALLAAVMLASRRRPSLREVLLIAVFLPLGARSVRMTAWWVLAMGPIVAERIAAIRSGRSSPGVGGEGENGSAGASPSQPPGDGEVGRATPLDPGALARPRSTIPVVALGLLAFACAFSLPWLEKLNPLMGTLRPSHRVETDLAQIAAALPHRAAGRIFTRLEWGEYFSWSSHPAGWLVFMDGRIEIYDDQFWQRYRTISAGDAGWEELLQRDKVDVLVLDRSYHGALLKQVEQTGRWKQAGSAGAAVLYRLSESAPGVSADTKH